MKMLTHVRRDFSLNVVILGFVSQRFCARPPTLFPAEIKAQTSSLSCGRKVGHTLADRKAFYAPAVFFPWSLFSPVPIQFCQLSVVFSHCPLLPSFYSACPCQYVGFRCVSGKQHLVACYFLWSSSLSLLPDKYNTFMCIIITTRLTSLFL